MQQFFAVSSFEQINSMRYNKHLQATFIVQCVKPTPLLVFHKKGRGNVSVHSAWIVIQLSYNVLDTVYIV